MRIRLFISTGILLLFSHWVYAQLIIDKKAIAKSGENLAVNLLKGQQQGKIRDFTENIDTRYEAIKTLQQQVLDELQQAQSIRDLHWADLSKFVFLATELVKGPMQPQIEIDIVVEPLGFNWHPNELYRDLFMAGRADAMPNDLTSLKQAKQTSQSLSDGLHQVVAERKAYAAVAFQYLSEDLILKATEMNEVLKQSQHLSRPGVATPGFSMTEAERIRLQVFSEDYLLLAGQLLERSDALLQDVASVKSMRRQADQQQKRLERRTIARTRVLDY
ncbi:hypothetical protein [Tunicatimonas pelagia]|uniref:hypothetical protein n=1 Tax=Tunicatimonas pelagia TaxID=931531 RepID=UPI0026651821|nr:hypothetical protein [Tunicatimonas pelagia]WKN44251.1 hypothetical protein P0M28_04645 [Tunicatimonas pelagia]